MRRVRYRYRTSAAWQRWTFYVFLPIAIGLASLAAIALWVLDTDPPPTVAAIDFDVDAGSELYSVASEITLLNLSHAPGAASKILPSTSTDLEVSMSDCGASVAVTLSVFPDPRWWLALRAGRRGMAQRVALQAGSGRVVSLPPGSVKGKAGAAIPGEISDVRVMVPRGSESPIPVKSTVEVLHGVPENFTVVKFRVPDQAFKNVLLTPFLGQVLQISFEAPWIHPHGFRSCYVALPALIEGQAPSIGGLGETGLAIASATSTNGRGPETGTSTLEVEDGTVSSSESSPPPVGTAITPTWSCSQKRRLSPRPSADCHALAVVDEPQRQTWQQLLLIVFGAVGTAGFLSGVEGLRRILFPWD